jgi:hypothetical protein
MVNARPTTSASASRTGMVLIARCALVPTATRGPWTTRTPTLPKSAAALVCATAAPASASASLASPASPANDVSRILRIFGCRFRGKMESAKFDASSTSPPFSLFIHILTLQARARTIALAMVSAVSCLNSRLLSPTTPCLGKPIRSKHASATPASSALTALSVSNTQQIHLFLDSTSQTLTLVLVPCFVLRMCRSLRHW